MKYEYTKLPTTVDNLITRLNVLGKEGWKIVTILRDEFVLIKEYQEPITGPKTLAKKGLTRRNVAINSMLQGKDS
jgi:hypothetical protein